MLLDAQFRRDPGTGCRRRLTLETLPRTPPSCAAAWRIRARGPHPELQDPLTGGLLRGPHACPLHQAADHGGHQQAQLAAVRDGRDAGRGQRRPAAADPDPDLPAGEHKLVSTTPLQPGATFPAIGRAGTETLASSDKTGLLYSGDEALAGLGDRLTKADSAFKDKLVEGESSPYIADTLAYQADVVNSGVNGTFAFTHKVAPENTVVFRTADGGALVLGRLNFSFDGTPKAEGDKLTIGDDAAALAGGKETSTGMVLNFAESVAVYVPPAGSKDPMKLVAATRGLVGAAFK